MSQQRFDFFVYTQNKKKVAQDLATGDIDYGSFSKMDFVDEFFAFVLATDFFPFAENTYPSPRAKTEVPPPGFFLHLLWQLRCMEKIAFQIYHMC